MSKTQRPAVQVTDHAVLRWLECECGVPVEAIRKEIARGCDPYAKFAPVNIKFGKVKFVLVNDTVVTTLRKGAPNPARENTDV